MAPKLVSKLAMKKGKAKGKAKSKGRGRGRGGRGSGRGAKVAPEEGADGVLMALPETEPKVKSLAGPLKKKVTEMLKLKTVEEALAETKAELDAMNKRIEEAAEIEETHDAACKDATHGFEAAKAEVEKAMEEEAKAAALVKVANDKKAGVGTKTMDKRAELMEAQKKLTMLEVMATAFKFKQIADESNKKAKEAVENAKKALQEQREREKEALAATKAALQEAKAKRLADAKAQQPASKRAAVEAAPAAGADID